jgi:lipoic acid synthetase
MKIQKPSWLKIQLKTKPAFVSIKNSLQTLNLHTVCEEARCPNINECWNSGTATFLLMGDTCTRGCRFCAIKTARKGVPLDSLEPLKLAEATKKLGLEYVVLTSVNRDDLADEGAGHFAACVKTLKKEIPNLWVEALIPDFSGKKKNCWKK